MFKKILAFFTIFTVSTFIFVATSDAATHTIKESEHISTIAEKYDTTVKAIMKLNNMKEPELQAGQVIEIPKVVKNTSGEASQTITYTIKEGEHISTIAAKYDTTVKAIMKLNNMKKPDFQAGQVIDIPKVVKKSSGQDKPVITYAIKEGEHISAIAHKYDTTVKAIMKLNDMRKPDIEEGQVIEIPKVVKKVPTEVKQEPTPTPTPDPKPAPEPSKVSPTDPSNVKKTLTVTATAYTAYCKGCSGITKTGINLRKNPDLKVIAVDPKVIPLGSKVWVEGYGVAIAGDIGGAIKGNKIDIFVKNKTDAYEWGRKKVTIKVLKS
ncbi:MAG: LysM peptidoglycan-binding domain-containing protein [Solibacillus sp.]|uniref:LysM peptidoglycan-binding domain-containing protein n=1 Tax=unclassified Solibacillus TaxID=2637870 RepID=UPI0030F5A9CF